MQIKRYFLVVVFFINGLLYLASSLNAQTFRGGIGGVVTDAQQAAVAAPRCWLLKMLLASLAKQ